jgi:hypothetical protein
VSNIASQAFDTGNLTAAQREFFIAAAGTKNFENFCALRAKNYFVIEDQNFGATFAVYDKNPETPNTHALYLYYEEGEDIVRMNRGTMILKKEVCITKFYQLKVIIRIFSRLVVMGCCR